MSEMKILRQMLCFKKCYIFWFLDFLIYFLFLVQPILFVCILRIYQLSIYLRVSEEKVYNELNAPRIK